MKYDGNEAFHEAGYDSYLTALVVIRLSAKLESDGVYVERVDNTAADSEQTSAVSLSDQSPGPGSLLSSGFLKAKEGISLLAPSVLGWNQPDAEKSDTRDMPPFDGDFWRVYGNKLRMFGTVERVIHLA